MRPSKPASLLQQPSKGWAVASRPTSLRSAGWSFLSVPRSQPQLIAALNRDGKPSIATTHQGNPAVMLLDTNVISELMRP
jgi:hypothetical protein